MACRARRTTKITALKNMVGGEIEEYTKMMAESREQALDRMIAEARGLGADAILDLRFGTAYVMGSAAEIQCYGNAVKMEKGDAQT